MDPSFLRAQAGTMDRMKKALFVLVLTAAVLAALPGCRSLPPSRSEQALFDVTTNILLVARTNAAGVVVTNKEESYLFVPGEGARGISRAASETASVFGPFGGLAGILSGAVFGVWGLLRSTRKGKTAAALAQGIEVARNVLKTTPQGEDLDSRFKDWLVMHQAEAGVLAEVRLLLDEVVAPMGARMVADRVVAPLRNSAK
jgi:hypothetical protein